MKFLSHKKTTANFSRKTGFTLVEMLVAVFVFSIVMMLATGAIFSIVSAYKTSQALKTVMDNLSSALDSMSRDIRYGTNYNCYSSNQDFLTLPISCSSTGGTAFAFVDKNKKNIIYNFNQSTSPYSIEKCTDDLSHCISMTAPNVNIEDMHFYVQGAGRNEDLQPGLLITVSGNAKVGQNESDFNIETMVDKRGLDMCKDVMPGSQEPTSGCQ